MVHRSLALRADGALGDDEGKSGSRTLMVLGAGLNRVQTSETDPSSSLVWDSEPLAQDLDVVGGIELQLDAVSTAADTAWIAILQDSRRRASAFKCAVGNSEDRNELQPLD